MKRKRLAKNKTGIAALLAKMDGAPGHHFSDQLADLSRTEMRKAMKLIVTLEAATIKLGYASLVMILRRDAKKLVAKTKFKK